MDTAFSPSKTTAAGQAFPSAIPPWPASSAGSSGPSAPTRMRSTNSNASANSAKQPNPRRRQSSNPLQTNPLLLRLASFRNPPKLIPRSKASAPNSLRPLGARTPRTTRQPQTPRKRFPKLRVSESRPRAPSSSPLTASSPNRYK
jgi:hypothetical protein